MRKITSSLIAAIGMITMANAQTSHGYVGINTSDPQATLDIVGSPSNASKLDGVIPPRLTGDELATKNYTATQTGAIVYATAGATTLSGQVVNVSTPAFYYFDGTVWQKIEGKDWHITGNSDTDPSSNFLGTINDKALVFKVNNTWAGYIDSNASTLDNVSFGLNALPNAMTATGSSNVAIGENAMQSFTAGYIKPNFGANTAVGKDAMKTAAAVTFSTAIGAGAMGNATNIWNSTAVGQSTLASVNGASNNTAIGGGSQVLVTTGSGNSSLGLTTLSKLTTGGGNIAIGIDAGSSVLTTGSGNILIGVSTTVPDNGGGYINIGDIIKGTGAPAGIYGSITDSVKRVGIATVDMPKSTLEVNGSFAATIRKASGAITASDYTILGTGDVTLPSPLGLTGRIYNFIYDGTNYSVNGSLRLDGTVISSYGINNTGSLKRVTVQSDGTNWVILY